MMSRRDRSKKRRKKEDPSPHRVASVSHLMHCVDFLLFFLFAQRVVVQNIRFRPLAAFQNVILKIVQVETM